ncbi:MAG: polysaccharide deacetylase family protein [Saprospiraceae bacterium]|nr:polysaccharide deacetylase family protein [Saprospiraceae bacterium]
MIYRLKKLIRRGIATQMYSKKHFVDLKGPIVSITFDDSFGCTFENAGKVLADRGMFGTFYVSFSFLKNQNEQPSFQIEHLEKVIRQGHEIGCHTYDHIDLSKTRFKNAIQDILNNQKHLDRYFPQMKFRNFSYPFGAETYMVKKFIGNRFLTARGNRPGMNVGTCDMANLKSIKLYENKYTLDDIREKLDQAIEKKAWLIFHTHDVQENYSQYGCSPGYLDKVLYACQERRIPVRSIHQALAATHSKSTVEQYDGFAMQNVLNRYPVYLIASQLLEAVIF